MALTAWHLRSRAHQCALTNKPFAEGDSIVTAIFPDPESSGYLRRDYHADAWESRADDEEPPFSFWRSHYTPPVHEPEEDPMKDEDPESLLQRLIEEDQEHTENVRYILAVMLERQKLLRETDAQPVPDGILRVYEHRKTGEAFIVRDPNIPLDEVERVQEEVLQLLEHGGKQSETVVEDDEVPAAEGDGAEASPDQAEAEVATTAAEDPAGESDDLDDSDDSDERTA